jgi:hypothetical protein
VEVEQALGPSCPLPEIRNRTRPNGPTTLLSHILKFYFFQGIRFPSYSSHSGTSFFLAFVLQTLFWKTFLFINFFFP